MPIKVNSNIELRVNNMLRKLGMTPDRLDNHIPGWDDREEVKVKESGARFLMSLHDERMDNKKGENNGKR